MNSGLPSLKVLASASPRMIAALTLGLTVGTAALPLGATEKGTEDPVQAEAAVPADADALTPEERKLLEQRDENLTELRAAATDAEAAQKALESLESDLAGLKDEQEELESSLQKTTARRTELDRRVADGQERLTALNQRQIVLRRSLIDRRAVLAEVLAGLQRIGRDPPPALLISPDDALSSVRSAILLGAVVPEIRSETDALVRDLDELARLRKSIATERTELAAALEDNDRESERLAALVTEKLELQEESERRLELERKRAASLAERSGELESVIASLEAEITRQREAALAARRAEEERKQRIAEQLERAHKLALAKLPEKNRIAPAYAFSALKGTLYYPVRGETLRYFGAADGSGHGLSGELVATGQGSTVSAPVDGWVVFAGGFRSYGQTLIIDAGDKYHLVLAGLDRISVAEGQFVLAGEPVATMGPTRMAGAAALTLATDKPTLYIEFRKDGKAVDPRPWWRDGASQGRASNDT
ncbi:murein hydrolase activator EnvC family protein [Pseudohoeflea suaedae]|nr:peptidoglycan DD-metalloendopeptidase family protein [Pseudohoeflea suaedae]